MVTTVTSELGKVKYFDEANLITVDVRERVFSEMIQLDELFGRLRIVCLRSGKKLSIMFIIGNARLTREVTDYFGKQMSNLLMEYADTIYLVAANSNSVMVSASERAISPKWRDNLRTITDLEDALRDVADEYGLPDEAIDNIIEVIPI
jgi:hypothetical protein